MELKFSRHCRKILRYQI